MKHVHISLESVAFDHPFHVVELEGHEALNQPFDFELMGYCREGHLDVEKVVSSTATLLFTVEGEVRRIHGLVSECTDATDADSDFPSYRLRLVPRFWRSTLVQMLDIFLDLSVPQIVQRKLELAALSVGADFEFRLADTYPAREFVVQYQETDLDFISRLIEHLGIHYFFEHRRDHDVIVFADNNQAHPDLPPDGSAPFTPRGERQGISRLRSRISMIPLNYVERDYNYRSPDLDMTATASVGDLGHAGAIYEYGGHFKDPAEGEKLARVRAEQRLCERRVHEGKSALPSLGAGQVVTVHDHPYGDVKLLVTEVHHHARQDFSFHQPGSQDQPNEYHNDFSAVPYDTVFRPKRRAPKPMVHGFLTGIVEATNPGSPLADVDDQGRYQVRFLFDTAVAGERQASRPVRMMQPHAGPGYGMHFPLRNGVEVLIGFVGGDPDRPIIAGTVPNPRTQSPVAASNKERNVVRTGGGNEINMDDSDGSQRIKLSSPRSGALLQLGSPNAPEDGAVLSAMTNVTTASNASANTVSSMTNVWSTISSTWANHVTAVAGKLMRIDCINYFPAMADALMGLVSDGLNAGIGVDDAVLTWQQDDAKAKAGPLDAATEPYETSRDALLAKLDDLCDKPQDPPLGKVQKKRLDALRQAMREYQARVDRLAAAQAEREDLRSQQQEASDAGETTTADGFDQPIKDLDDEITKLRGADTVAGSIAEAQKALQAALAAVKNDAGTNALVSTELSDYETKQGAYEPARASYDDACKKVDEHAQEQAREGSPYSDSTKAVEAIEATRAGISSVASPLYSLITMIAGTGIEKYAALASSLMLKEATAQHDGALPPILVTDKPEGGPLIDVDLSSVPSLASAKTKEKPPTRANQSLGAISRLDWDISNDTIKMVDGSGAGLLGFFTQRAAYKESRNLQGSEQHSVLFGKQSAYVTGQKYAAMSSLGKVLVTSDQQTVVHSRGNAEVAGVGRLLLSSAKVVDVLSRGSFVVKVTDGGGGTDLSGDVERSRLVMQKALARLSSLGPDGNKHRATIKLESDDEDGSTVTIMAGDLSKDKGALSLAAGETAEILAGSFGMRATKDSVKLGNTGYELHVAKDDVKLGAASNAQLVMTADKTTLASSGGTTIAGKPVTITADKVVFGKAEIESDNLVVKGAMDSALQPLQQKISQAQQKADDAKSKAEKTQKDLGQLEEKVDLIADIVTEY
jgi:type VI secretion system secreted protein VgrG